MGLTFKENCPDIRNTRVVDIIHELEDYGANVEVHDPWVDAEVAMKEYGVNLVDEPESKKYQAIVLAVAHDKFVSTGHEKIRQFGTDQSVLFDVKYMLPKEFVDGRL
jgi:UDP-N-acetyl-D-galactosamine dehydrogenase